MSRVRRWLIAHEASTVLALLAAGVGLRTLLVIEAPAKHDTLLERAPECFRDAL